MRRFKKYLFVLIYCSIKFVVIRGNIVFDMIMLLSGFVVMDDNEDMKGDVNLLKLKWKFYNWKYLLIYIVYVIEER